MGALGARLYRRHGHYPLSDLELSPNERTSWPTRPRTRASARPSSESGPASTSAAMTSAAASASFAASGHAARCSVSARLQSRMPRLVRYRARLGRTDGLYARSGWLLGER